ncbi:MAG: SusC/RagA family TonB-linked outer membrane protein, partial [Cyclobacteriaceae bacterium]
MSKLFVYAFLIQCLSMSLLFGSNGNAQVKNIEEVMIQVSLKEVTVEKALGRIQKASGFQFVFTNKDINNLPKVTLENKIRSVYEILQLLSVQTGLQFKQVNKNILVHRREAKTDDEKLSGPGDEFDVVITGTITDEEGGALPGVTVLVEGTNTGTVTDNDGKYTLEVPENAVVIFSFLGFESKRVTVGNQTEINLVMAPETSQLGEVVVVGYGLQDKVNLTGSITMVNTEELAEVSMPNLAQGLMGRTPGVFIKNSNGQAGQNKTSFNIRGFGSALIIVDGLPVTEEFFQQIDPNEIESFNVLKDAAAAAVYGARAGNGVVLVTTKRGVLGAPKFTYSANFGQQFIMVKPEFVPSWQYAAMENVARTNLGEAAPWSIEQIDAFRNGSDPENYPNTDWWNQVVRDYSPQAQHNLNIRGGTERVKYFASLGYFTQDDMLQSDDTKHQRYSLRSNLDIKLTERLEMGIDISLTNQEFYGPSHQLERTRQRVGIMTRLYRSRAYWSNEPFPDPSFLRGVGSGASINPHNMIFVDNVGFQEWNKLFGFAKLKLDYDLGSGFKTKAVFDLNRTYDRSKVFVKESPEYDYNPETGEYTFVRSLNATTELTESSSILKNINQQFFLTWDGAFGDHDLSALAVYEQLADNFDFFTASRRNYEFDLPYLFAGPDL